MSEEEKSMDTHHDVVTVVEHQSNHFNPASSSSQAPSKVYATTAEAIANFKPTHREVISGIAPHVFDERKRRRSQRRASSLSRTYWCVPGGKKRSSPLRGTTVSAGDEHSISLHQPDPQHRSKDDIETNSTCAVASGAANVTQLEETTHKNANGTIEKIDSDTFKTDALWKYLRIDTHLFKLKSIAVKLKSTRAR